MGHRPRFHAIDAEYERRVRESFAGQGLMNHFGAHITDLRPGYCEVHVKYREHLTQQHGYFHAGVSGAIADSASGYAAYTLMPANAAVLTVEYKMNFLAPAAGKELVARARVLRSGKTLKICAADVFVVKGSQETHCATMLSTVLCLAGKSDRRKGR